MKVSSFEVGISKVCLSKTNSPEVEPAEVGPLKIDAVKIFAALHRGEKFFAVIRFFLFH
jgi:hypothetical protein